MGIARYQYWEPITGKCIRPITNDDQKAAIRKGLGIHNTPWKDPDWSNIVIASGTGKLHHLLERSKYVSRKRIGKRSRRPVHTGDALVPAGLPDIQLKEEE